MALAAGGCVVGGGRGAARPRCRALVAKTRGDAGESVVAFGSCTRGPARCAPSAPNGGDEGTTHPNTSKTYDHLPNSQRGDALGSGRALFLIGATINPDPGRRAPDHQTKPGVQSRLQRVPLSVGTDRHPHRPSELLDYLKL